MGRRYGKLLITPPAALGKQLEVAYKNLIPHNVRRNETRHACSVSVLLSRGFIARDPGDLVVLQLRVR